jgi:hypothetical protein
MFCCEVDLWTVLIHFFLSFLQFHFILCFCFSFLVPLFYFLYIFIFFFFLLFIFIIIYSTYLRQGLDYGKPNTSLHLFYFLCFRFLFSPPFVLFLFIYFYFIFLLFIYFQCYLFHLCPDKDWIKESLMHQLHSLASHTRLDSTHNPTTTSKPKAPMHC